MSLLLALHKFVICWSNLTLESNLTPKRFSQSLFFILKLFTFKLTSWLVLTRKCQLSVLLSKRLFSNHLNRDIEACSRDSITSSTFLAERYGLLLSAKSVSISLFIRNKSAEKMLNRSRPKIELYGTPNITASHSLYELLTIVLCFLCDR